MRETYNVCLKRLLLHDPWSIPWVLWKLKLHTPTHPAGGNLLKRWKHIKLSMNFILKQVGMRLSFTLDTKGRAAKSTDDDLYKSWLQFTEPKSMCSLSDYLIHREKSLRRPNPSVLDDPFRLQARSMPESNATQHLPTTGECSIIMGRMKCLMKQIRFLRHIADAKVRTNGTPFKHANAGCEAII